ncbi:MAG: TIGR03560 family F420-dependent LLM class oxidoreductase [Chloroflexota bacterium]|nr:TIGR03560 family F420-dependent LLM class oxidoreductase [Chloroflexota bacterium]
MMARPLRFGIKTAPQDTTYEEIVTVWKEADGIPVIEHAWLFDHYSPINGHLDGPCLEGWQTLAALAVETSRVRLGLMVTGNTYRHPAVLTKIAITTDIISRGRLDFGIGAGWNEYEHTSMGIPLYPPGERIRRLNETCEIYKSLCTQHLTTYEGRYYQLNDARSEPKPVQKPYPPITIGGSGEQLTLRVVAKHADIWNATAQSTEIFQHKASVLREHCAAVGRDPDEIEYSVQIPVNYDDLAVTVQAAQSFVDVGATHLILNLRPPFPAGIVTRLAEEVIPKITQR